MNLRWTQDIQRSQFPLCLSKKLTNFSLRRMICEPFADGVAQVHNHVYTYTYVVRMYVPGLAHHNSFAINVKLIFFLLTQQKYFCKMSRGTHFSFFFFNSLSISTPSFLNFFFLIKNVLKIGKFKKKSLIEVLLLHKFKKSRQSVVKEENRCTHFGTNLVKSPIIFNYLISQLGCR